MRHTLRFIELLANDANNTCGTSAILRNILRRPPLQTRGSPTLLGEPRVLVPMMAVMASTLYPNRMKRQPHKNYPTTRSCQRHRPYMQPHRYEVAATENPQLRQGHGAKCPENANNHASKLCLLRSCVSRGHLGGVAASSTRKGMACEMPIWRASVFRGRARSIAKT